MTRSCVGEGEGLSSEPPEPRYISHAQNKAEIETCELFNLEAIVRMLNSRKDNDDRTTGSWCNDEYDSKLAILRENSRYRGLEFPLCGPDGLRAHCVFDVRPKYITASGTGSTSSTHVTVFVFCCSRQNDCKGGDKPQATVWVEDAQCAI